MTAVLAGWPGASTTAPVEAGGRIAVGPARHVAGVRSAQSLPRLLTTVGMPGSALGVAADGDYVFVAHGGGLAVVDVSHPASAHVVASLAVPNDAGDVAVAGGFAYATYIDGHSGGLVVIDVSSPTAPRLVGRVPTPGAPNGVAVAGSHAYVADFYYGLQVIDVTDPAAPRLVATAATRGYPEGVALMGNYAYLSDWNKGLAVIDVSDPAQPRRVAGSDALTYANGIAAADNRAFVTGQVCEFPEPFTALCNGAVAEVDVGTPWQPHVVASVVTPGGGSRSVAVMGDRVYMGNWDAGLAVIDVSSHGAPRLLGSADTAGEARDVAVAGDYVYVADGLPGLVVFAIDAPPVYLPAVMR